MTRPAPTPGPGSDPPLIAALTGLRAIAAGAVVLFHLREPLFALLPATRGLDTWLIFGFLGVDVFFVLSGFVISYNYAVRLVRPDRRRYLTYLRARFARVYPVHLVTLLVVAAAVLFLGGGDGRDLSLATFVGNLAMLQALPGIDPWNGASWSISCEAAAYVVFPLVAAALTHLRRRTAIGLAALLAVMLVAAATTLGFLMSDPTIALFWVRITAEFAIGSLLWAAWRHAPGGGRRWDVIAMVAVVVVLGLLAVPAVRVVYWVVVPLLALSVVAVASSAGVVRTVLASRVMEWGGRISYSLYLVHVPALSIMFVVLAPGALSTAPLPVRVVALLVYVAGCLASAAGVYYLVEEPARARLGPRRRTDTDATGWTTPVNAPSARS